MLRSPKREIHVGSLFPKIVVGVISFVLGVLVAHCGAPAIGGTPADQASVQSFRCLKASESLEQESLRKDAGSNQPNSGKPTGQQGGVSMAGRIPKLLHHVFIIDSSNPANANLTMWPQHERWVDSCRLHYSRAAGWEYMYWNASSSEELIAQHYPSFLDFYRSNITLANEKSDVVRYLLMHQFGGLYLDSDTQCWREAGDMLEGYDVVLQGTHIGEGVGSASIASAPGVPLWQDMVDLVRDRKPKEDTWYKSLERTGPNLLRDTLLRAGLAADQDNMFQEIQEVGGLVYRVYKGGSFFLPCQWYEDDCRKALYAELASGQTNLRNVVGMHRFAGSWIAGKENGRGIIDIKTELCTEASNA